MEEKELYPYEFLSLLHSIPEPLALTQICAMLGINRKEGRKLIRHLERVGKVVKEDRGYTTAKFESLTI